MAQVDDEKHFSGRCTELLNAAAISTAIALASRCGLLGAMLNDEEPKSAFEWAMKAKIGLKNANEILALLYSGEVIEMSSGDDGVRRYCIPSSRVPAMKEMGSLFETLLLRRLDVEDTFAMVKYRTDNMMELVQTPSVHGAAA
mmetsp:Transcript_43175/g.88357  ORF Transcript_43175/g.88357 Transcript_43175/m.88357 type:complete len:143 (-) Transcript_43175:450-878(-)|eukprot:CAMPEP_0181323356 /NCGR_PEP_ID=MMETSP1101-20121128/19739_1 /TAXON_ID=46948 /ORGANISM="Rhodomonas abbreviata, Strain Caron Lab Isolate" /LENGTH=142 /DNA_ID=CAMNT_0023431373 /DNA_START=298 /DNA_END=726 /DNA_ORIENTATION=-